MLGRNHRLTRRLRALRRDGALRRAEQVLLAEGAHLTEEALACGAAIELIVVSAGLERKDEGRRLLAAARERDVPVHEVTPQTTTSTWWVTSSGVVPLTLDPRRVGFSFGSVEELRGADPAANAAVARAVCQGQHGPVRDAVLLNAGLALALYEADLESGVDADDIHAAWSEGVDRARTAIDEGRAQATLEQWAQATQAWS